VVVAVHWLKLQRGRRRWSAGAAGAAGAAAVFTRRRPPVTHIELDVVCDESGGGGGGFSEREKSESLCYKWTSHFLLSNKRALETSPD